MVVASWILFIVVVALKNARPLGTNILSRVSNIKITSKVNQNENSKEQKLYGGK
jgi:hypothetical protein